MQLAKLVADAALTCHGGDCDVEIAGVSCDSRAVQAGFIFAALSGKLADGVEYAQQANDAGAAAIYCRSDAVEALKALGLPLLTSAAGEREGWSDLAATYCSQQPKQLVAITGTDGKTSTADFYRQIVALAGKKSGSIGTLGVRSNAGVSEAGINTSPEPATLHATLQRLAQVECEHVALEASSMGIAMERVRNIRPAAVALTTFGRDHLDDHGTMDAYWAAKRRLFSELAAEDSTIICNAGLPQAAELRQIASERGLRYASYGRDADADLKLTEQTATQTGQRVRLRWNDDEYQVDLGLYGLFQAENMLAASMLAMATEIDRADIIAAWPKLVGVQGRSERIASYKGAEIFIDYAHTANAIRNILTTLRPHCSGKLWIVFGCGGDRDAGKRPLMGQAAAETADHVIVTDDNPRTENPAHIRQAVMRAVTNAIEIADRADAIGYGLNALEAGDMLVVTGKGHEQGQIVGNTIVPFDDAAVIRAAIDRMQAA